MSCSFSLGNKIVFSPEYLYETSNGSNPFSDNNWLQTGIFTAFSEHILNTFFTTTGARYHKGSVVNTPLVFVHDDEGSSDANNVITYTITEQGENLANSIYVDGQASAEIPITSSAQSLDSITNRYGLFEEYYNEPNISDQDTLDDRATEYLDLYKDVPVSIKFGLIPLMQPRIGTYDVGDLFNVRFKLFEVRNFVAQYRLYGARVHVDSNGTETTTLDLNIV